MAILDPRSSPCSRPLVGDYGRAFDSSYIGLLNDLPRSSNRSLEGGHVPSSKILIFGLRKLKTQLSLCWMVISLHKVSSLRKIDSSLQSQVHIQGRGLWGSRSTLQGLSNEPPP